MARRPNLLAAVQCGLAVAVSAGLSGCGAGDGQTALAVRSARWTGPDQVAVTVECADVQSSELQPGAGTERIPLLTVWGDPKPGGCATTLVFDVPAGTTRIDDAATGMVVDLPPSP